MTSANRQLGVLRHPDFRLLWLAASASVIGDMLVRVAVALFVVDLTGSATDVGLVLAAYTLPLVGFLLLGGVIADRLPRHLVVVASGLRDRRGNVPAQRCAARARAPARANSVRHRRGRRRRRALD